MKPRPTVNHHLGPNRQASGGTRQWGRWDSSRASPNRRHHSIPTVADHAGVRHTSSVIIVNVSLCDTIYWRCHVGFGTYYKVSKHSPPSATELLVAATSRVRPTPGRTPWNYGWCVETYRQSDKAAIKTPSGVVSIDAEGVRALEAAAGLLLRDSRIRERWEEEEFWGFIASLVATAAVSSQPANFINENVDRLRNTGPALTMHLIANVTWSGPPLAIGDVVLGAANDEFVKLVNDEAKKRPKMDSSGAESWLKDQIHPRLSDKDSATPVAIASWTIGQAELAHREAARKLDDVVNLCLLLENDLDSHQIYRRGATNRPGIRGLTLDRGAIERGLNPGARIELASQPVIITEIFGDSRNFHWFNAEPLPLGTLLLQGHLRQALASCLTGDPISNKVRLAARWFGEAHYSLQNDDTALALGVAMDALLSAHRTLPGSAMADRFALLESDAAERRTRVQKYLELYSVRSSVAHGGQSSKLENPALLHAYFDAVRWAAHRLLILREKFALSSLKELDDLFDDLRLGAKTWPPDEIGKEGLDATASPIQQCADTTKNANKMHTNEENSPNRVVATPID